MGTKLTTTEAKHLAAYETIVHQGLDGWVEVTVALLEIRDRNLWIGKGNTFLAYCKAEFDISRTRVYQLIESCKAAKDVSTIVDCPAPRNEGVARELSKVKTEQERADLWTASNKTAPANKSPTAAHVAKTRREMFPFETPPFRAALNATPADAPDATAERDDFQVELDDASDVFRLLADQDLTAVQRRIHVLRLEFEEKLRK